PASSKSSSHITIGGYEGVSYRRVIPTNAVTFVNYDKDSPLDDYYYISSVPYTTFYSKQDGKIISSPLLFYTPPRETTSDEEKTLNAFPGVDYFMEDYLTVNGGSVKRVNLVGFDSVPPQVGERWKANEIRMIKGSNPYDVSSSLALDGWSYSRRAVLAVINPSPPSPDKEIKGEVEGQTPSAQPESGTIEGSKMPSPVDPNEHKFTIDEGYKYIDAVMTWSQSSLGELLARGKDPDLQLYDMQLGEVAASEDWNVLTGASEHVSSYVYHSGEWMFAVTYMPTESYEYQMALKEYLSRNPELLQISRGDQPWSAEVNYQIDYTIYPGVDLDIPDEVPFFCRDATIELTWSDTSSRLGLILLDENGAEVASALDKTQSSKQVLEVKSLGMGRYRVSVVNLEGSGTSFKISYSFRQVKDVKEGDSFASAANGAVLASELNAPLLFVPYDRLPRSVEKALNTLGVKEVYVVDLGGHAKSGLYKGLDRARGLLQREIKVRRITNYNAIYREIMGRAGKGGEPTGDIVFTTIDPWSYWYVAKTKENPAGEFPGAYFVGPATFTAAHHGSPVFITDTNRKLSQAQAWHNNFWLKAYPSRLPPSVGCMVLEGKAIYSFLQQVGADIGGIKGHKESIITVADQFDIGTSWDRALVGAAQAGRIMGSPVDASVWISRSIFYPKIIFANPAVNPSLDPHEGKRWQGSSSTRIAGKLTIVEPEREVETRLAVQETWVSYQYKFNERGSEYWGCKYQTRTGIVPGETPSDDPIDPKGVWPDIDTSNMVPYYLDTIGYDHVQTTTFERTIENLNRGVIMWFEVMHGGHTYSGVVGWWDPKANVEKDPWRGYEENGIPVNGNLERLRGATDDPDVVTMNKHVGLDVQPGFGPVTGAGVVPETHDGIVIALLQQRQTEYNNRGLQIDEALQNLHSMGFSAGSCLIANTYLHLSLVRHGSIFQVIDPWLTSWYSSFAMEVFLKDIYYNYTVGEAYERGIAHVGILYLVDAWWWDIFENLVFYGDPDLKVYSPRNAWSEPESLNKAVVIGGHTPFGAKEHPDKVRGSLLLDALFITGVGILTIEVGRRIYLKKRAVAA
ncbi:MAG: cell wall-binding repeat-containing protein, partial [Thermoplasmata archaeon]|nr:cell wall-binding repeat-containing protein [Thermoplasmata archaeon]